MIAENQCNHRWTRDDVRTKQCVRCGAYAPVEGGDD
jgi:Zn ribbon nucleic-acid-binding protein